MNPHITVIAHFYNESFLLPYWLSHHRKLFDDGILIDYDSTDNSVEIIKSLTPHWRIVKSKNKVFRGSDIDVEVQEYESEIKDWKTCLNITEFIITDNLKDKIANLGNDAAKFFGYEIVDTMEQKLANDFNPNKSIITQRHSGFAEKLRNRLIHKRPIGRYYVGRHASAHEDFVTMPYLCPLFWYCYAPLSYQIPRKLQMSPRIPKDDFDNFGVYNYALTEERILQDWKRKYLRSQDLLMIPSVRKEYDKVICPKPCL